MMKTVAEDLTLKIQKGLKEFDGICFIQFYLKNSQKYFKSELKETLEASINSLISKLKMIKTKKI